VDRIYTQYWLIFEIFIVGKSNPIQDYMDRIYWLIFEIFIVGKSNPIQDYMDAYWLIFEIFIVCKLNPIQDYVYSQIQFKNVPFVLIYIWTFIGGKLLISFIQLSVALHGFCHTK